MDWIIPFGDGIDFDQYRLNFWWSVVLGNFWWLPQFHQADDADGDDNDRNKNTSDPLHDRSPKIKWEYIIKPTFLFV